MTKKRETKIKKSIYRFNKQNKNYEFAAHFHICRFFSLVSHHRTTYNTVKLDRNDNAIVALIIYQDRRFIDSDRRDFYFIGNTHRV